MYIRNEEAGTAFIIHDANRIGRADYKKISPLTIVYINRGLKRSKRIQIEIVLQVCL